MSQPPVPSALVVGVIGGSGKFGRWIAMMMEHHYPEVTVHTIDVGTDTPARRQEVVAAADILWFSVPIPATPTLIREYAALLPENRPPPLWLDVTSLKAPAVGAFMAVGGRIEAVGLHPMCAPPPLPTMAGRVLVVSEVRPLSRWAGWVDGLLARLEGRVVRLDAAAHDRRMALVQAGCHAGWIAQGLLWSGVAPALGGLQALREVKTPSFALLEKATSRVLSGSPGLYADIQLQNPETLGVLRRLGRGLDRLADCVERGDREALIADFLEGPRRALGAEVLEAGNEDFERLTHLLASLDEPHHLLLNVQQDQPGTLVAVLSLFAGAGVNLKSIQSVRSRDGQLRFHLNLDRPATDPDVVQLCAELEARSLIFPA